MRTAPWWRCCARWPAGNPEGSVDVAVFTSLSSCLQALLLQPSCPICSKPLSDGQTGAHPCDACELKFGLKRQQVCHGRDPLPWIAAGLYSGALRQLLLQLRQSGNSRTIRALCASLRDRLPNDVVLAPIPSWKHHSRANPLPRLLCEGLERPTLNLLQRTRAGIGQHHLRAHQRHTNQNAAFSVPDNPDAAMARPIGTIWIVDDILTTGATAMAARAALIEARMPVAGLLCLARTPRRSASSERRDLRSGCRADDAPG